MTCSHSQQHPKAPNKLKSQREGERALLPSFCVKSKLLGTSFPTQISAKHLGSAGCSHQANTNPITMIMVGGSWPLPTVVVAPASYCHSSLLPSWEHQLLLPLGAAHHAVFLWNDPVKGEEGLVAAIGTSLEAELSGARISTAPPTVQPNPQCDVSIPSPKANSTKYALLLPSPH